MLLGIIGVLSFLLHGQSSLRQKDNELWQLIETHRLEINRLERQLMELRVRTEGDTTTAKEK